MKSRDAAVITDIKVFYSKTKEKQKERKGILLCGGYRRGLCTARLPETTVIRAREINKSEGGIGK